jgi:hypothetical protein
MKRRRLFGALLAGAAMLGVTLMGAQPAQAAPGSCSAGIATDNRAYGNCTTGTGQYRLGIPCKNWFTAWHQYSGWAGVGVATSVGCPFGSGVWWDIPGGPHVLIEKRG